VAAAAKEQEMGMEEAEVGLSAGLRLSHGVAVAPVEPRAAKAAVGTKKATSIKEVTPATLSAAAAAAVTLVAAPLGTTTIPVAVALATMVAWWTILSGLLCKGKMDTIERAAPMELDLMRPLLVVVEIQERTV
jgi:archaellum biogenesis protein FlaJ (TadC family)